MKGLNKVYEVCVRTNEEFTRPFIYRKGNGQWRKPELREGTATHKRVKMVHIEATNPKSAKNRGGKHGYVVSVRKVKNDMPFGNIEKLDLRQPPLVEYVQDSPYNTAIAMDEMLWQKRNKRIKNREKDKNNLDK